MDANDFIKNYWQYYIELEKQVIETQRFVAFDVKNNATFSMEYIKLLQIICSEIDVVGKAIAVHANPAFAVDNKTNFNKWGYEVQQAFPGIDTLHVIFWGEYQMQPWKKWRYVLNAKNYPSLDKTINAESPFWWNAYNGVKHQRTSMGPGHRPNYMRANLKTVTNSLAALYLLEKSQLDTYSAADTTSAENS